MSTAPSPTALRGPTAPGAGVSHWWPTPARALDHFSAEQLDRSARLHGPIRRIRVGAIGAQLGLLVVAGWLLGPGPVGRAVDGAGATVRALAAGLVVALALRLPEWVAGHRLSLLAQVRPAGGDATSSGRGRLAGLVGSAAVLAVVARFALGPFTDAVLGWLLVLGLVVTVVGIGVVSTVVQARRLAPVDAPPGWSDLVERAGVGGHVRFGLLADPSGGATANACAIGVGGRRGVLLDPALLAGDDAPDDGLRDFVVAHELVHLARRHPEIQLALNGGVVLVALGTLPALAATGWPWSLIGLAPDDPRSLPVAALLVGLGALVCRLPVAWVLRALERFADGGAVRLVGVPDRRGIRSLHLGAGGELAPPVWASVTAAHPTPVERLEYLARRRRAGEARPGTQPQPRPQSSSGT